MPKREMTRDQERAHAAYQAVSRANTRKDKDHYGRQCLRLPALIHQCGLCQTIAFFQAKGGETGEKKEHFRNVLEDLAAVSRLGEDATELAQKAREEDMKTYQWMTREALASAQWLKRYAEAVLKVESGGGED